MPDTNVTKVRTDEVEWEPLGGHGLSRKLLAFDSATQAATSLVNIPVGWRGGGIAHYHHAFEEVMMLAGSVTVGGKHYWSAGDYFYRPAHVVHGHDERSPEGALALIRSDGPLELILVHEPAEDDEYPLGAIEDPRGHVTHVTVADVAGRPDAAFPAEWRIKPLSANPRTGSRTLIAEIPAGWLTRAPAAGLDRAWEGYVLDGALSGGAGDFVAGDYASAGPGAPAFDARQCPDGCTLILWM